MRFIDDKKSVMKEIQQIKKLLEEVSKRSNRLGIEFLWGEEDSPLWEKDVDGQKICTFLDQLSETSADNAQSVEWLNVLVSNGKDIRGDDARS